MKGSDKHMGKILLTVSIRNAELNKLIRTQAERENRTASNVAETILKLYYADKGELDWNYFKN